MLEYEKQLQAHCPICPSLRDIIGARQASATLEKQPLILDKELMQYAEIVFMVSQVASLTHLTSCCVTEIFSKWEQCFLRCYKEDDVGMQMLSPDVYHKNMVVESLL